MDEINQGNRKKGLIWTARVLYVLLVAVIIWWTGNYINALDGRINFTRIYYILSSAVMYVLIASALVLQFGNVFLNKSGNIKGRMLFFAGMIVHINDRGRNVIRESFDYANGKFTLFVNYSVLELVYIIVIIAVMIAYHFVIKKMNGEIESTN